MLESTTESSNSCNAAFIRFHPPQNKHVMVRLDHFPTESARNPRNNHAPWTGARS